MKILSIGFTKKRAEHFFETLREAKVKRIADVRLNNVSQLAGFSKKDDLKYFLNTIAGIGYTHIPELAPTKAMLDAYKENGTWTAYEKSFIELMAQRRIETTLTPELLDQSCLLCSEAEPDYCHRRLVAEYLQIHWPNVVIEHLN